MPDLRDLLTLGGALLAGGISFGGLAVIVRKTDQKLDKHIDADERYQREVIDRLARIETLLEELRCS